MSNKQTTNGWQKTLNLITNCPICDFGYTKNTTRKFLDKNTTHLVHFTCGKCQAYFLAIVMELGKGISTIGMVTDLNFLDVTRLYGKKDIDMNEVINACEFIEGNEFYKKINN